MGKISKNAGLIWIQVLIEVGLFRGFTVIIPLSIEDKKIINGHHTEDEVFDEPDNSPTIENAIQEKDFDKLVKYVLEGDSERLAERSSEDEEMQEFIKNIPAFQVFSKMLNPVWIEWFCLKYVIASQSNANCLQI